ncbi:hypothetical protein FRX31_027347 [Thalictrum thalictroides]|uniref:Uncharacterized protein n=1 Tax=Thalictrum thalictroides TaxID=46969 RepID=A0A7J6VE80_THATH|nr:hypothetical protein FRX31_027347 [Thalictrum thalictroides]
MSLHLGSIPRHIRQHDLERVFRKFGQNSVQLKDGYGFVVYDDPANAEKALRALKGKYICGEKIYLAWSNNQPKPLIRQSRSSRFYGGRLNDERNFTRREDRVIRQDLIHHERNFTRREDRVIREELIHHERSFTRREDRVTREDSIHHVMGFKMLNRKQDVEGGRSHNERFHGTEDNYRCGDVGNHGEEKFEFVKEGFVDEDLLMEPNFADNGRWGESVSAMLDKKEADNGVLYEPNHGYGRRVEDVNRYKVAPHSSSARGRSGKKSQRDHFADKHTDNPIYRAKCHFCGQRGHIKYDCPRRNALQQEKFTQLTQRSDVSFRGKGKHKRVSPASWGRSNLSRSPTPSRRYNRDGKSLRSPRLGREGSQLVKGRELLGKNKRRREDEISVKEGMEAEKTGSLLQHSDSSASSSSLRSRSRSRSCSRSKSRSVSSRAYSLSSSPSSMPTSSKPMYESFKSRSPAPLSSSESLCQSVHSSPSKAKVVKNCTLPQNNVYEDNWSAPKHVLLDQRSMTEDAAGSEKSNQKSINGTMLNENGISSTEAAGEMDENYRGELRDDGLERSGYEEKGACMIPSQKFIVSVDRLSSEDAVEEKDFQISGSPEAEDIPSTVQIKKSTKISQLEMYMVLKHYGFAMPNENEEKLSLQSYFGSARLWPWEIIYYRRSKKGPISNDNYARRMAQNEEFGIVDKYIRSSSGWEECC